MTQEVEVSTFIEFSRTLTDTKANFSVTIWVKIGEEGIIIGHEFGASDGTSQSSAQGEITVDSLRKTLEACRNKDSDGIEIQLMLQVYDEESRSMSNQAEDLSISLSEPLNFRPFLLQFLPIIIKTAELMDKHQLPSFPSSSATAKC